MLHANFTAVLYRTGVTSYQSCYTEGIGSFALFCSRDLDLEPMTFMYEHEAYPPRTYSQTENELSTPRLSKVVVLQTDIPSYRHDDQTALGH